jgi:hypothetical protein
LQCSSSGGSLRAEKKFPNFFCFIQILHELVHEFDYQERELKRYHFCT